MTQEIKKDMILHRIAERMERNVRMWGRNCSLPGIQLFPAWETNVPSVGARLCRFACRRINSSPKGHFLRSLMLLLLVTAGISGVWGQVENGLYYVKILDYNGNTFNANVYACPSQTNKTNGQPYVSGWNDTTFDGTANGTTYSFDATYFSWVIKQVTVNSQTYYVLINVYTNQYMVWDSYNSGTGNAVHLETKATEPTQSSEHCFYSIYDDGTYKYIHPDQTPAANNTRGLNYKGNFNATDKLKRRGTNGQGLLQFYDGTKNDLVSTLLSKPTINEVNASSIATITEKNNLPEGYRVRYTFGEGLTIPEDPTATSPIMDASGFIVRKAGTLKVVIERYGVVLTGVDSKYVVPTLETCANPSISYDNTTGEVTINCTDPTDATIYYTTDGTTIPTSSTGTLYSGPVSITAETTFKAVATYAGRTSSEVATKTITKVETPTIVNNGANIVMSCATNGATIYYTTEATGTPSIPYNPNSPPVTSQNVGNTFRAIAKKDDYITSDESASLLVKALCHLPVISFNNETGYVTITKGAEANETIHYTIDGTDPTAGSTEYTAPFEITTTTTIKAIAIDNSGEKDPSVIATETYSQVETPTIQNEGNSITISSATEGATIYYKIGDETTPHVYSAALGISDKVSGRKISAYAMKTDMITSTTAVATASDTKLKLTAPVISIPDTNDNGNVQFSINNTFEDAVTYYYTIDGTTVPTSSSTEAPNGLFTLTAPAIIKVIATSSLYETSDVATSSSYVMPANIPILIQSKQSEFYYLIPNLKVFDTDYPKNLTTLNVPCSTMVWKFENAADNDGQYFYIKNSQGGYMYYTDTNNDDKYIYFNADKNTSDDGYKFSITRHNSGGYNIIPKGQTTPINKPSITGDETSRLSPVKLTGAVGDTYSRWEILPYTSTESLPQWTNEPFKVWDEGNKSYRIKSVQSQTKPLILNNDGNIRSQTLPTSNYDLRKSVWVIKKVGTSADRLLDYYTFQNPYTGDLLYYNGKGRGVKDNTPVLQMGKPTVDGADEKWSHFVIVQTMPTTINKVNVIGYNIIPRDIVDDTKAISRVGTSDYPDGKAFNCINRAGGNDSPGTWYDNDGNSRWTFEVYTDPTDPNNTNSIQCMPPVITYQDNKIRISTIYDNATIYYTINGDDPKGSGITPTSVAINSTTLYTDIDWNDGISEIKAYVSKTGYTDSEIETYTPAFEAPVISYDAINDKIIITSSPGSTVYYTQGETEPTDPTNQSTEYINGSEGFDLGDNINVIKAIAYKGAQSSDVVTLIIPVHAHTAANDRPYLIQSAQSTVFFMIPGDVDKDGITRVNTSSLGRPSMEWYFIGAGYESGVTYYYIKNKATNEYVYFYTSGNNSYFSLHTAETFDYAENKSGYKFSINYANTSTNPEYYIIHPLNNTTSTNGLSKAGGNNAADVINLASSTTGDHPEYARWKFILSANKPVLTPQLKVWGSDGRKYYKIKKNSANDATAIYLVPRSKTVSYAIASVASDVSGSANSILWYFDVASSNEWVTYYYVVNAATGEYLYFNGDETKSANDNALEAREELVAANNDRYLFAFAKTTSSNQYYFLPKVLQYQDQDLVKNSYSLVFSDGSSALTSAADRAANGGKWYLAEADVNELCSPKITLEANGVVNLTPRTRGATVTYMVDGGAETVFESTPITSLSSGNQVVITTKTSLGGTTTTKPVTVVYMPTIELEADQTFVYNGQTHAPELSSVTMGSTELKDHCVVSSDDIDAGNATAIITQKEDDSDYVIYGTAPFTIAKSPLTIYADSKMIEYGEDRPELTFSTFGLASIDVVEVNLSCASGTEIGSYPIVFNNLTSGGKYTIKRHEDGADASSNYNEDVILVTSSLIITGKSLGDGENIAEGITAEVDGEDVSVKRGTTALEEGTDYTVEKSIEGYYDDWIWTITGKGEYSGSAIVASILSNYSQKEGEWRAGYVASHDWEIPEGSGIEAWIATSVNTSANFVLVKKVDYLPAGVPVILTATADKSSRIAVSPQKEPTLTDAQKAANLLKVVTEEDGMHVNNTEVYVFYQAELVLSLAGTLTKGRIYMDNPNKTGTSAGARMLRIVKEEEATDILVIEQTPFDIDNHWYSLDGRTLSGKPTKKGIYINDGRKVVIK